MFSVHQNVAEMNKIDKLKHVLLPPVRYNPGRGEQGMRPLDIPEILIAMGVLAMVVWGIYNLRHHGVGARK